MYFGVSDNPAVENLRDDFCHVGCGMCSHFSVMADQPGHESTCKRIDHKRIQFYHPWFKSYDCGQFMGIMCKDFSPASTAPKLVEEWLGTDEYVGDIPEDSMMSVFLNGNKKKAFFVKMKEFYEGTFITEDLKLRSYGEMYYKIKRSSPTGYELVRNTYTDPVEIDFLHMEAKC